MSETNPFVAPATTAQSADAQAESVVAKEGGEESQKNERRFTSKEMEAIVKDRLTREQKKFAREREELLKQKPVKVASNVEEEFRTRQAEWENEKKQMSEKLTKYRTDSLRAAVERKLNEYNCLDSEVVLDHFTSRNLVALDDDGNVVVNTLTGNLDDLCKDYLAKKPHLVRAAQVSGVGTKGPKTITSGDMSLAEKEQLLGIQKTVNPFRTKR